ncbi:hypothetical protein [Micromonospora sp. KC207]|uniref:hypothetical protein n=1 Tax=Micromonospora sp. KC207 TaxID=2530377 RepID=UPI001A9D2E4C|nr:hypothetical protein [Micromonospora sp. KC207]
MSAARRRLPGERIGWWQCDGRGQLGLLQPFAHIGTVIEISHDQQVFDTVRRLWGN